MTAKEIYDLIRNKPYKDGEKMIKDYAKQKVIERDDQWKSFLHPNENFWNLLRQLPKQKFD